MYIEFSKKGKQIIKLGIRLEIQRNVKLCCVVLWFLAFRLHRLPTCSCIFKIYNIVYGGTRHYATRRKDSRPPWRERLSSNVVNHSCSTRTWALLIL
jgi:hypothetical protein